jgi:transposase
MTTWRNVNQVSKVTRIAYGANLNQGKHDQLAEIADRLGLLRSEVWQRYGSIAGVGLTDRKIRDQWLAEGRRFDIPARLWKETLRVTIADITAYREAAKVEVRQAIRRHTSDEQEQKRLYTLLKYDRWTEDSYLRRQMREHFKHGQTQVDNQIVLDSDCYTTFELNGKTWLKVMGPVSGQRITIPLNTNIEISGSIRLILRDGRIEVHYAVEESSVCVTRPCGDKTLGIDKGYTEVYVDSDGDRHGEGLGKTLSTESDYLKVKYQRRNKLKAIADKKPRKRDKILKNNLGRKKLDQRKKQHRQKVRDKIYKATHSVVDKARQVVCEDLPGLIVGKSFGKNQNRRLSGWVKGIMAESLEAVTRRRGSAPLALVNAAYSSQTDSRYGVLLGERRGDRFYCFDGVLLDADHNAALNLLARLDDPEIGRFTPYKQVKSILLARTKQFTVDTGSTQALVAAAQDAPSLSTECELPFLINFG